MGLLKRFGWYFVGVSIGIIAVIMIYGDRTDIKFNYFPNARVLSDISKKEIVYTPSILCQMTCYGLDTTAINGLLNNGDVRFKESDTKKEPYREYQIYSEEYDPSFTVRIQNQDTTAHILTITLTEKMIDCNCD